MKIELLRKMKVASAVSGSTSVVFPSDPNITYTYVAGPDPNGFVCVLTQSRELALTAKQVYVAPLCWVDDTPIYRGDKVYSLIDKSVIRVEHILDNAIFGKDIEDDKPISIDFRLVSTKKPKVKRTAYVVMQRKNAPRNDSICNAFDIIPLEDKAVYNKPEDAESYVRTYAPPNCFVAKVEWEE